MNFLFLNACQAHTSSHYPFYHLFLIFPFFVVCCQVHALRPHYCHITTRAQNTLANKQQCILQRFFSFLHNQTSSGTPTVSYSVYKGQWPQGPTQQRDADHSCLPSADMKMHGAIPPPFHVLLAWCLIKHRDNLTFYGLGGRGRGRISFLSKGRDLCLHHCCQVLCTTRFVLFSQ
jgi:hypothetical protein